MNAVPHTPTPAAPAAPAAVHLRRGWLLWADWCSATGRSSLAPTAANLEAFQQQVTTGTSYLSDVAATVREIGLDWPYDTGSRDPWQVREANLVDLAVALAACPRTGWPGSYRGRRDAWLLTATRGMRFTRSETLALTVADIETRPDSDVTVAGRLLHTESATATCGHCILLRWLEVRATEHRWSRSVVREQLKLGRESETHECVDAGLLPRYLSDLPACTTLAPAIDQHGWLPGTPVPLDPRRPDGEVRQPGMTPRALSTVIARRCLGEPPRTPTEQDPEEGAVVATAGEFDETTLNRLDEACDAADEVNARVSALLSETAEALRKR